MTEPTVRDIRSAPRNTRLLINVTFEKGALIGMSESVLGQ